MSWLSSWSGVHLSPQHGFSIEPGKLLNNVAALGGNPIAIAGSIGNAAHAVAPHSGIGRIGSMAGDAGAMASGMGIGSGGGIINNLKNAIGLGGAVQHATSGTDDGYGGVAGDSASTMAADDAAGGGSGPMGDIYKAVNGVISVPRPDDGQPTTSNGGGGLLNTLTGGLTNGHGGLSDAVLLGLAGAEGVMGANAYGKMGNLQNKALNSVEGAYNERAPLRTAGLSMMQNTLNHPVNASATFADPGNPYQRPPVQLPSAQPQQPAPQGVAA